jgi:hypothetical protein
MKKVILIFFLVWLCYGFGFSAIRTAQAQKIGIRISPIKIEDIVDPGEIIKKEIKVGNESDVAKTFYIYLKDFKAGDEYGRPRLMAPGTEPGYYLASWIRITKEPIHFNPGEEKIIPFTIEVPKDASPGGYYGAVYFGTKPPRLNLSSEDKGAGSAVAEQNGVLILLRVKGEVNEDAKIREFNTDKEWYSTPFKVNFLIRVENNGNVHVKPYGQIVIKNMFGKEVGRIKVNERGGNVLPYSFRKFKVDWSGKRGFGRYSAELGLTYGTPVRLGGQGKSSLVAVKYFWIIPWNIIIPGLLGLIFIIGLVTLLLKLYKNKAVRRAMEEAGLSHVRYIKKYQGPSPTLHFFVVLLLVLIVLFLLIAAVYFLFFA